MGKKKEMLAYAFEAIMENLNYDAIAAYYNKENWMWAGERVTATMLMKHVRNLVNNVVEEKLTSTSSGGVTILNVGGHLAILFCKRLGDSIIFGELHCELSSLTPVSDYFQYLEDRYTNKKLMKQ